MTKDELLNILSAMPDNADVLIDISNRYAEVKDVRLEYSQRPGGRKPYVIVYLYE